MPAVGLHDDTYDKLRLLSRAWNISEGEAVARLLMEFQQSDRRSAAVTGDESGIAIFVNYEGIHTTARYEPSTNAVTITSGGLAGNIFKSPSGAAVALVSVINPSVKPNRSGWSFWTITESGDLLHTLRPR